MPCYGRWELVCTYKHWVDTMVAQIIRNYLLAKWWILGFKVELPYWFIEYGKTVDADACYSTEETDVQLLAKSMILLLYEMFGLALRSHTAAIWILQQIHWGIFNLSSFSCDLVLIDNHLFCIERNGLLPGSQRMVQKHWWSLTLSKKLVTWYQNVWKTMAAI